MKDFKKTNELSPEEQQDTANELNRAVNVLAPIVGQLSDLFGIHPTMVVSALANIAANISLNFSDSLAPAERDEVYDSLMMGTIRTTENFMAMRAGKPMVHEAIFATTSAKDDTVTVMNGPGDKKGMH